LRNVLGAQRVGMHAVHFDVTNPAKSYNEALAYFGLASN
jgi:putative hydrolase of the HAD superfamily